ncbi:hypothetical protein L7F22_059074 [Adiantum nelumboides]|nr:hypothetical protein [Adiantum nelumboides]
MPKNAPHSYLSTTNDADINSVSKPLIEGISYPATPMWNFERPFLNGHLFQQGLNQQALGSKGPSSDPFSMTDLNRAIGIFAPSVQELLLIDDLLFTMVGIEGKYITLKKGKSKESTLSFQIDPSMDLSLQELAKRILPLCESYNVVSQFTELRSHFKYGLVNHALAAALRAILQRRASTHTRTPTATNEDDEDFQDSDPASEEDDDEVLEDVVVEEVLADEEDILDDDEEA